MTKDYINCLRIVNTFIENTVLNPKLSMIEIDEYVTNFEEQISPIFKGMTYPERVHLIALIEEQFQIRFGYDPESY